MSEQLQTPTNFARLDGEQQKDVRSGICPTCHNASMRWLEGRTPDLDRDECPICWTTVYGRFND